MSDREGSDDNHAYSEKGGGSYSPATNDEFISSSRGEGRVKKV
jgi:hypothetical protein